MEQIISKLIFDFQNVHSEVFDSSTATFRFTSEWKGKTNGVSCVVVYLSGTDPLTGESIPKNAVSCKYSAGSTGGTAKASYYGDFHLRFDAVLDDGQRIEDFIEPKPVQLQVKSRKPKIEYTVSNGRHGFARIDFGGTNCWQRCNGHLWIKSGKRYQRIPKLPDNSKVCYAAGKSGDFQILTGLDLPQPKRKEK